MAIKIVARSPSMRCAMRLARRYASSGKPIAIVGEPGTGRRRLAKWMHERAHREGTLLEVELLDDDDPELRLGKRAKRAPGGSLVLVGDAWSDVALDEPQAARIVVIATTPRDDAPSIVVPPLRERLDDLPDLVISIVDEARQDLGCGAAEVTSAALDALCGHDWPGNVRELATVLRHATVATRCQDVIGPDALPARLRATLRQVEAESTVSLAQLEKTAVHSALRRCGGRRREAARALGISLRTLQRRLVAYRQGEVSPTRP